MWIQKSGSGGTLYPFTRSYQFFDVHFLLLSIVLISPVAKSSLNLMEGRSEVGFCIFAQARQYSTTREADLVVIGSGPGGYVGAIKAVHSHLSAPFSLSAAKLSF
jgi:hypothetical protein